MSKFLITVGPTNDFGLLTRSLPIARELKNRGHEVAFCHPASGPQIVIAEEGFQNLLPDEPLYYLLPDPTMRGLCRVLAKGRPLRTLKVMAGIMRAASKGRSCKENTEDFSLDDFLLLTDEEFTRAHVASFIKMIKSYKADAIVDNFSPWACIAARILKKPVIVVLQSQAHPQSPGLIWWKDHPADPQISISILNDILTQHGSPPIKGFFDLMLGDLTLVVGMPELDPIAADDVNYIGAILWQNQRARLSEAITKLGTDRPVVWIYTGRFRYAGSRQTSADSEVVLQSSVKALAKENLQVVLTTGHQDLPKAYSPLPPNFHFEPFVPGLDMARRSDLMIHHGGYGSCQTGLYMGIPQVIIPTMSERESNARRVLQQGAGEIVLPTSDPSGTNKKVDASELAAKVRKVLSTPSYKENALRVSAKLREYGGAPKAAQLIEEYLAQKHVASEKGKV
ncbi:MAG TPA: nucleotide disphospho-sugar-binding domain-containing protein [Acidobacteriota bacterium]|nr:nucleotide disphospho-sugar-binding domain-containing protein [Acidobacteriota bacterium]